MQRYSLVIDEMIGYWNITVYDVRCGIISRTSSESLDDALAEAAKQVVHSREESIRVAAALAAENETG